MQNYISYVAAGKDFQFGTALSFSGNSLDYVAQKIFLKVSFDRDTKLREGLIPIVLSEEEKSKMTDNQIIEWQRINTIVFVDYASKKKMSMRHLSDFIGQYKVEQI